MGRNGIPSLPAPGERAKPAGKDWDRWRRCCVSLSGREPNRPSGIKTSKTIGVVPGTVAAPTGCGLRSDLYLQHA
ncbi:hypothetical protein RRG08_034904 [Elysia crispata]|uniref:Uncharacterized protein n=1 Tax=Elysia crispata TaxID=231223 RepID=A0AAE0YRC0_9GAST|nr:hypothetical protein RRG08_034904 [Elysia crispata]